MNTLSHSFRTKIKGVIEGFDRIVFKVNTKRRGKSGARNYKTCL